MTEQYLPVLLMLLIAIFTAALILILNAVLGPKKKARKDFDFI